MDTGLIFPRENWHNHASCIVELSNGDMQVCWFHGSGERQADDVLVQGARYHQATSTWSDRVLLADALDYPDCNPCMFVDSQDRLWLVHVTILANEWHTALLKSRRISQPFDADCPQWDYSEVLHVTPGQSFMDDLENVDYEYLSSLHPQAPEAKLIKQIEDIKELGSSKLYRRLGWMPRAHATVLSDKRIVLPLYSDGFDFSLMLLSDDDGETWHTSHSIISCGGIQPSVVERKDGSLVAFMRNNGPAPKRILQTISNDRGESWSKPELTDLPNPGAGIEAIRLQSGLWAMIYNDLEDSRHRLAITVSRDEGESWAGIKYLQNDDGKEVKGSYHYPSIIQAKSGDIWISYSNGQPVTGSCIQWAKITEDWLFE